MVVKQGASTRESLVEHGARRHVERQRGKVLHHDQVRVTQGSRQGRKRRRVVGADRESGESHVTVAVARHGRNDVTEASKGGTPLGGFDRDAVGAAEAKTHDDETGHEPRLRAQSPRNTR